MFLGWIYSYIIAVILLSVSLAYNVYCLIGLFRFTKKIKEDDIKNIKTSPNKFNIYIWLIKKTIKSEGKLENKKLGIKTKLAKKLNWVITLIESSVLIINIVILCTIYILNIQATNISNVITTLFGDKDCSCYAKCTGNSEDDDKTAYELLFGPDEYKKLYNSIVVTPSEKQPFLDMISSGASGKEQGEWLIAHLDDNAVQCYKNIVGNNNKFRSGDHQDRSKMTNGELKDDLVALLKDYKVEGRNPNCETCFGLDDRKLGTKCLGEAHYVPGWTWEAIWNSDNPGDETGDDNGGGIGGGGNNSAQNSPYGIQLDDGWYYWYQQADCSCAHNVDHPTYGRYGSVRLVSNTAVARGCSSYSTAMAISNAVGAEITPFVLLTDIMGGKFTQDADGIWSYDNGGSAYINYRYVSGDGDILVSMNKASLASRVEQWCQAQGYTGVHTAHLSLSQSDIDSVLSKGGYVIASWKHGMPWYHPNDTNPGSHFMVIRKKDENGKYYCLDSNCSDAGAYDRMTLGITWSQLSARFNNSDSWGIWNDNPPSGGGNGGGDGGDKTWDESQLFVPLSNANIGVGQATSAYITLGNGEKLTLYDGLPWECPDTSNSYMWVIGSTESTWRNFYKAHVGHDYPNRIQMNGWHTDTKDKIYTDYPGLRKTGSYLLNYAGRDCIGIIITPSLVSKQLLWEPYGNPRSACTSHRYAVVLEKDGKFYYAPAVASGGKGHTWPGGIYQTYISHSSELYGWEETGKADDTNTSTSWEAAISALEDGRAGRAYGTNPNNQVQASMEAYIGSDFNANGFTTYGVIVYSFQ